MSLFPPGLIYRCQPELLDFFLGTQDSDCHLNFIAIGGKKIAQLQSPTRKLKNSSN